jgi:predicted HicB family RNase H-like nuclease
MSYIIGKITRKVSKQHNEYFVGKVCNLPVRASWAKKGQDDLCIFLDKEKIDYLSEQNKAAAEPGAEAEGK